MTMQATTVRERVEETILSGSIDLPVLSGTVSRLLAMSAEDGEDARAVADLIRTDQGLAGRVIARVNAAVDAPVVPVASLRMAVSRLGFRKVRQLALAEACGARIFDVRGFEKRAARLFEHALVTAAFAQEVARELRSDVEEAFFAGLLHDAGEGVVLQAIADWRLPAAPDEAELNAVLVDFHGAAGEALTRAWELPERISAVVRHHHRPEGAGGAEALARLVHLADDLAEDACRSGGELDVAAFVDHEEAAELALYEDALARILSKSRSVLRFAEELRR